MELNIYQHSEASQALFKRREIHKANTLCGKMGNYLHLKNKGMLIKISEMDEILIDHLNYLVLHGIIPNTWIFLIEVCVASS